VLEANEKSEICDEICVAFYFSRLSPFLSKADQGNERDRERRAIEIEEKERRGVRKEERRGHLYEHEHEHEYEYEHEHEYEHEEEWRKNKGVE